MNLLRNFSTNSQKTNVGVIDVSKLKNNEFEKEVNLSEYILDNIILFCADVLEDQYISHETEVQSEKQTYFQPRQPRIDIRIRCKNKTYLVELKNPKNTSENRHALGQILAYSVLLDEIGSCDLVIVTTKYDILTAKAIKKFNLPVRYVYFEKGKIMEYLYG